MAGKVQIQVLGTPQVILGDAPVKFPYRKTEGIFYYLCMKKQATRDELVNIFWADTDEKSGKKNVRQVLYQLKKIMGDDIILTQGNSILMLNTELALELDWEKSGEDFLNTEGEFLQYFYIKDCPEFDEWIEEIRERQKERWEEEIRRLLDSTLVQNDVQKLYQVLRRWNQMNPLSEHVVTTSMEYYANFGQYNMAIQLFYEYKAKLWEELEEEPGEEILRMFHRVFQIKETTIGQEQVEQKNFYGRTSELFRINDQVQRFRNREACISQIICGNLGVGKSALMERIYQMNQANNILRLYCHVDDSDQDFYMRAWGDVLRQLEKYEVDGIVRLKDDQKVLLKKLLHGDVLEEQAFVSRTTFPMLENRILNLFRGLAEQYRVVLYIDDIQWMDAMSRQVLQTLMMAIGNTDLYLLATCRTTDNVFREELVQYLYRRQKAEVVTLSPFSKDETSNILRDKLPMFWAKGVTDEIYRRTEGNALVLMDLLDVIERDGEIPAYVPDRTGQVLALQLRDLTEDQIQLLQVISVFMNSADINEIRVLMRKDLMEIYDILESLQKRHMLREEVLGENLTYRFRHKAYQDYIYQNQSLGKRRLWHQMVAEYYESQKGTGSWFEFLPFIIYQYDKCGNTRKAEQYRVQYYCEFFALSNENFPMLRTNMEYDEVAIGMSDNEQDILNMARRMLKENLGYDNVMLAECHFLLGRSAIVRGQYGDGISHIQSCISMVEGSNNRPLLLGAYRQMVFYGIQVDDRGIMDKYIRKGMERVKDDCQSSDYATLLRLRGLYEYRCDQLEKADVSLREAFNLFTSLMNPECHYHLSRAACVNYRGKIRLKRGQMLMETDPEKAQDEFRAAEDIFRQAIDIGCCHYVTNGMGQFRANLGQALLYQGRLAEAEASLRESIECFSRHEGFYWGWDRAEAYLSLVCWKLGLNAEAEEHLAQAEKMITIMGNPWNMKLLEECIKIIRG